MPSNDAVMQTCRNLLTKKGYAIQRYSVSGADEFTYLDNPEHLSVLFEESLEREIVHLIDVVELFFRVRMVIKESGMSRSRFHSWLANRNVSDYLHLYFL